MSLVTDIPQLGGAGPPREPRTPGKGKLQIVFLLRRGKILAWYDVVHPGQQQPGIATSKLHLLVQMTLLIKEQILLLYQSTRQFFLFRWYLEIPLWYLQIYLRTII